MRKRGGIPSLIGIAAAGSFAARLRPEKPLSPTVLGVVVVESWLRIFRPHLRCGVRLVCFPHAGGSAAFYRTWLRDLPDDVELLAVQYPGRGDRLLEQPYLRLEPLAAEIAAALHQYRDRPLVLFGHSFGAAVAYEVARLLQERAGAAPRLLAVSGRGGPAQPGLVHQQSDEALWEEVRQLGGTDRDLVDNPELRSLLLPALRGDYTMSETYQPAEVPLDCPVVACVGDADPKVAVEETSRWAAATRVGFRREVFSGDHFYLVPHQSLLVSALLRTAGVRTNSWSATP